MAARIIKKGNRFHQLAMYVDDPDFSMKKMMDFGYRDWTYDEADLVGECMGEKFETHARMYFNYEFYGDSGKPAQVVGEWERRPSELEFLRYEGESWHSREGRTDLNGQPLQGAFFSHMSVNVEDGDKEAARISREYGVEVIQWFDTSNHVNKYLRDRKVTFHEHVLDTRLIFGFDMKLIQKVQHD